MNIKLDERIFENFGDPIQKIWRLLDQLATANIDEAIFLDYKDAKFTSPFFLLSLPLIVEQYKRRGYNISISTDFNHGYLSDYMNYIYFPRGLDPDSIPGDFNDFMSGYQNKSYIPIICFPTGSSVHITEIRDAFLSAVNILLIKICGVSSNMITAIMYLIDEAVNNVLHHSKDDKGYLFAQYYKSKGYIDLVVADIGQTILETYAGFEKLKNQVTSHKLAMEAALAGKSTKSADVDRGFGISTSKELLTKGLNGKYFIYSGNVCNMHNSEINEIYELPETIHWQGVYLCLRIPVVPPIGFRPSDYYE